MMLSLSVVLAGAGCHKTFYGSVTQPNPLVAPTETLRTSEAVRIVTGDMELYLPRAQGQGSGRARLFTNERYPLQNTAQFTVVSRDRLRFHVQIEHKWEEYADLKTWHAYLIDDQGHKYLPETVEQRKPEVVVFMWDREVRTAGYQIPGGFGNITSIREDAHRNRQTLGSLAVFRGKGDYVFYKRDIFSPAVRRLTLVIERRGLAFAFTWRFAEPKDGTGSPKGEKNALAHISRR